MHAAFTADEILYATSSHLKSGYIDESKGNVIWNIDDLKPGDWFIAIPHQLQDPHDNLNLAFEKGARGVIVNRRSRYASAEKGATIISVPDTKTALLDLVRYWRHCVQPKKVVGVSGSCGRRVTMILLHQTLQETYRTHVAFMDNLGWFGCVKEIFSMPKDTELLIFEAGAVERGDITRIGGALDPDLAILTSVRHALPSPERDALTASLYCELLETVSSDGPKESLSAVIYDDNSAVQKRVEEVFQDLVAQKYSLGGKGISHKLPESSIKELSEAMQATIGQPVTRADLWCAIEGAKALGFSTAALEEIFELSNESVECSLPVKSAKQIA